jgi:hypothetical protein
MGAQTFREMEAQTLENRTEKILKMYNSVISILLSLSTIAGFVVFHSGVFVELTGWVWILLTIYFLYATYQSWKREPIGVFYAFVLSMQVIVCIFFWTIAFNVLELASKLSLLGYVYVNSVHGLGVILLVLQALIDRRYALFSYWTYFQTPLFMIFYLGWAWIFKALNNSYPYDQVVVRYVDENGDFVAFGYKCTIFCALQLDYENLSLWSLLVFGVLLLAIMIVVGMVQFFIYYRNLKYTKYFKIELLCE